jgi:TRAP-type uncharacterized transport system fused permease subunit
VSKFCSLIQFLLIIVTAVQLVIYPASYHDPISLLFDWVLMMVIGMQTVWVMGNETEIMNVRMEHIQGYLSYGGNVNGNNTHDPHVVHFKGGDL